jgi:hypothetical protein
MADFVDTARELDEMLTQGFDQLIRLAQGQKSQG